MRIVPLLLAPVLLLLVLPLAPAGAEGEAERDDLERRFRALDRDGDGRLTRAELPYERYFERADGDGDGFVTLEEARAVRPGRRGASEETSTPADPAWPPLVRHLDLRYRYVEGVDPSLHSLDLYAPEGEGPHPVVVMIHGGGWRRGDKAGDAMTRHKVPFFVGEGFVYVSLNYRLSTRPDVKHPAHVEDVAHALAWLHDHVARYGGDPSRLHLMGHSAGAHLAALVATDHRRLEAVGKSLRILQGVICLDTAAYDVPRQIGELGAGPRIRRLYEQAFGATEAAWRDASPQHHVAPGKRIPPMLLFHAGARRAGEVLTNAFAAALREAGTPAQVVHAADKDHAGINACIGQPDDPYTALVLWFLRAPGEAGRSLPRAEPEAVGLDAEVLGRIDAEVERSIGSGALPGASVAVARNGKVAYAKSFGTFADDSILRIYSMTKPVTVAAALILVDDGKMTLDDPVAKHLPGFAMLRVLGSETPPTALTIRHLMQHTAGFSYGLFGNTAVDRAYREQDVLDRDSSLEEMVAKLAKMPLLFAPGTRWHYSVSIDVLGRVIEVVSGQPFDVFLRTRLFEPLGMHDTAFSVPDEKADRLVDCCGPGSRVIEAASTSPFRTKPGLLSGGGGLVSTMGDYLKFALMLEAGGVWNGKRILEAETVARMTTHTLPDDLLPLRFGFASLSGMGFGLGVAVDLESDVPGRRAGAWGWAGAASTTFFVSPRDRLVVVVMAQRMPLWNGLDRAVRRVVFEALQAPEPAPTR